MFDPSDPNAHLTRFARLRDIAIATAGLGIACVLGVSLLSKAQPLVSAISLIGVLLLPWVIVRPWWGLLVFLWLAHTIDGVKRLVYSVSNFSQADIASILIVPVLVAGALYVKIFFLKWFGDRSSPPVRVWKFWPILIAIVGGTIFVLRGGLEFRALITNHAFICYIPAGIAVPYILYNSARQQKYARTILTIVLVVGAYGLVQTIRGEPWDYELQYMRSGYTITINAIEETLYFRAFSLLNNGATFAGVMVLGTLVSLVYLCREDGRIRYRKSVVLLFLFTAVVCFAATQRGALLCFLITLAIIPLFERPKLFLVASVCGIGMFAGLIIYSQNILELMYAGNEFLASKTNNAFMMQNANLLTYGQRLQGFGDMANPALWTPFGSVMTIGGENTGAHDMISNCLEWFGYVGTAVIVGLAILIVFNGLRGIQKLNNQPAVKLWCQANLAVVCFMLIWGLLLGDAMHVSPMNFYFWSSIGNVLFAYHGLSREKRDSTAASPPRLAGRSPVADGKLALPAS